MPLPGSHVIHPAWLDGIRQVAETAMTSTVELRRPSTAPPAFDPTGGRYTASPSALLWTGPCRIQPEGSLTPDSPIVAEQRQTYRTYQVTIPMSAPQVEIDDTVVVIVCPEDPHLTGRSLQIHDVRFGDFQAERHFTCRDTQPDGSVG